MIGKRLAAAAAVAAAGWLVIACADRVAGPRGEIIVPFAISEEQRAALSAALEYASRDESMNALGDRDGAARISAALTRLADRIAHNDLNGAQIALHAARGALSAYREQSSTNGAGMVEIETMALALEHVALLATGVPSVSLYARLP